MKNRLSLPLCFLAFALISLYWTESLLANADSFTYSNFKVCLGSSSGLSHTNAGQPWNRYLSYVSMYANCTIILDSLEIVFLDGNYNYDMSFLESIREVNGYVWIVGNNFDILPLKNLRVIRGWNLYKPQGSAVAYSLYVSTNQKTNSTSVGLKELQLNSLREILYGNILIENNNLLCHEQTINWTDIRGNASKVELKPPPQDQYRRPCEECHPSCTFNGVAHCWGPGPDKCQKITNGVCNSNCEWGCFGPGPYQCCDWQCAGGCGHNKSDCWACRHFVNNGVCVDQCPSEFIYNRNTYKLEPNPDVRYAFGAYCVKQCPDHTLTERGACVTSCSEGHMSDRDRKCRPCKNGVCPKTCPGNSVDRNNVGNFSGCTIIDGNLQILMKTFTGLYAIAKVSDLDVFESLEEITGYLLVQGNNPDFNTLSFLRNLRVVKGRTQFRGLAVVIKSTSLVELGLTSLKEILSGSVIIHSNQRLVRLGLVSLERIGDGTIGIWNNPNLCYVDSINWTQIMVNSIKRIAVENNANQTHFCETNGSVCSSQCSSDGCWGPKDEDCRFCAAYRFGRTCVASCRFQKGLYPEVINGTKQCQHCHKECLDSCNGTEANHCVKCRNVRDGPYCRAQCPKSKYVKTSSSGIKLCEPCYEDCKDGCNGPGNHLGYAGCKACHLFMELKERTRVCLQDDSQCPSGFYRFQGTVDFEAQNGTKKVLDWCRQCDGECQESTLSTNKYRAVNDISMSPVTKTTMNITTALPDDIGTDSSSNYWFVVSLSLVAVVSIFLVLMAIIAVNFYIRRKRISAGREDPVHESNFASLDRPMSDEYEIMPYAYTDGYDKIDDIIETDLDVPIQFPRREGPLPTPGYDNLLPRPSTPTVYNVIDNYDQPMYSEDIEISPGHIPEAEQYSDTIEHSVTVNAKHPAYTQLIGDEQPVDSEEIAIEISPGHTPTSEQYSDMDKSFAVEHGVKVIAKHPAYLQLINDEQPMSGEEIEKCPGHTPEAQQYSDTIEHSVNVNTKDPAYIQLISEGEDSSPTFSAVSVAREEINQSSITSSNSVDEIPSSYLKINEDTRKNDSSEEIPPT